eukprot:gene10546-11683_t
MTRLDLITWRRRGTTVLREDEAIALPLHPYLLLPISAQQRREIKSISHLRHGAIDKEEMWHRICGFPKKASLQQQQEESAQLAHGIILSLMSLYLLLLLGGLAFALVWRSI